MIMFFFFFNDTATTEIYTLSLHDALPIYGGRLQDAAHAIKERRSGRRSCGARGPPRRPSRGRSEEHTSELQSQSNLVCRLLLEKKKNCDPTVPTAPSTQIAVQVATFTRPS